MVSGGVRLSSRKKRHIKRRRDEEERVIRASDIRAKVLPRERLLFFARDGRSRGGKVRRARDNTISAGEGNSLKKLPQGLFVLRGAEKTPVGLKDARERRKCARCVLKALSSRPPLSYSLQEKHRRYRRRRGSVGKTRRYLYFCRV